MFTLVCRHCGDSRQLESVEKIVAWYLIHVVKQHWEFMELVHESSDDQIMDAYTYAMKHGII